MTEQLASLLEPLNGFQNKGIDAIGLVPFLVVLAMSLACGVFVSVLYQKFYGSRETGSQIQRAFPLLSLAITSIFVCIQFSLPLSLGLLGALSIVRFRTPIKEPEEIGFLMVVIATSLACATFNFEFLGVILLLACLALLLQEIFPGLLRSGSKSGLVMVSMAKDEYLAGESDLLDLLTATAPRGRVESISQTGDECLMTYSFRRLEPAAAALLRRKISETVAASDVTLTYERHGSG